MKCKSDILATSSPSLNIPALASFYGTSKQTEYSNLMSTFISAGALYQKKFSLDFHSMLAFFSAARCIMNLSSSSNCLLRTSDLEELEKRKDSTATLFGRIRCTGADTPCPFTQEEGQDPSPYESIAFIVHANSFLSTEVKLSCELDGKTAPLSSFYPDSLNAAGARVKHTPSDSILPILNHVKIFKIIFKK